MPKVQFGEVLLWQIFNCIHRFFAILAFEIQRPNLIFLKMNLLQNIPYLLKNCSTEMNPKNPFLYGMASKLLF